MKVYRGAAGPARTYVEADRSRADDYYLAEGTGIARRYAATGVGPVAELPPMNGDGYEAWVAGHDPETGEPRGRLRTDEHAVRFVEVVVNGPKSWSLAAELHPDVAAAYEAAQDRAATEIIGWLAEHATTRLGPRGGQVAVPLEQLEAAVVRHYTSRAGDPHRHLHLQINARVVAAGRWRGIDTVAVRDSIAAVNGIGHAAVACDPVFRTTLAGHGYTLDAVGEITQLARYVGPFSRRAAQIGRHIDRYEAQWSAAHPGAQPGPALRRCWDVRAWAEDRPEKVTPRAGADLHRRWLDELEGLGYRGRHLPVPLVPPWVGRLDRDQAAGEVLARLGAARSVWNAADIRGEVEQHLARTGIVADPAVRRELAEDLTARSLALSVPLLTRAGLPDHVRASTSAHVVEVEADLVGRLAVRAAKPASDIDPLARTRVAVTAGGTDLDAGQIAAIAALAGDRSLVVVEGVAGAGKTTTLAATRDLLTGQGQRLVVVTPTLKAAKAAAFEIGAHTGSAAWLVHQHGWRWTDDGTWTRLTAGDPDPVTGRDYTGPAPAARLAAGDLLVVDEAGMLDQDTARALLTVADEQTARVAFLGDRHQLAAVGRGGVLDLAARWADPHACVSLDVAHRCTRPTETADGATVDVPDVGYAALASAMRTGDSPEVVFDALHRRGQIRVHTNDGERLAAVAEAAVAQRTVADPAGVLIVAATVEQVTELNAVIRDRLVAAGAVDDTQVLTTDAGQRLGAGDTVATRRNDPSLDVANRDTWTVTRAHRDGQLTVISATAGERVLPADYVRDHVELAYATTAHGAQGATATAAHLIMSEHTGAAAAYVGMTRGRHTNTAHLVADHLDGAREQWVAVFGRDRADLGPDHARHAAEHAAAQYGSPDTVDDLTAALRQEWDREADDVAVLAWAVLRRDELRPIAQLQSEHAAETAPLEARHQQAREAQRLATERAEHSQTIVAAATEHNREASLIAWNTQRREAHANARTVLDGSGRLGLKWAAVNRASEALARWAVSWQPIIPAMPTGHEAIARFADRADDTPRIHAAINDFAGRQAAAHHPEHERHVALAAAADRVAVHASAQRYDTRVRHQRELGHYGSLGHIEDADAALARIAATEQRLDGTRGRIDRLEDRLTAAAGGGVQAGPVRVEPSRLGQPSDAVLAARRHWLDERDAEQHAARLRSAHRVATPESSQELRRQETWRRHDQVLRPASPDPGVGR
ncbi:MAG: MobF family relaxase [Marmoricola sp.]